MNYVSEKVMTHLEIREFNFEIYVHTIDYGWITNAW